MCYHATQPYILHFMVPPSSTLLTYIWCSWWSEKVTKTVKSLTCSADLGFSYVHSFRGFGLLSCITAKWNWSHIFERLSTTVSLPSLLTSHYSLLLILLVLLLQLLLLLLLLMLLLLYCGSCVVDRYAIKVAEPFTTCAIHYYLCMYNGKHAHSLVHAKCFFGF